MNVQHQSISEELRGLAQKIDDVKREDWSLDDEKIQAYIIGKDQGAEDVVTSVVKSFVDRLEKIQISIESIYASLNSNGVACKTAFLKMDGLDFTVIFSVSHDDFHNMDKKKLCYETSRKERIALNDNSMMVTYSFTCEDDLSAEKLDLHGYNLTFEKV